jgi:ribosomal protein S27E
MKYLNIKCKRCNQQIRIKETDEKRYRILCPICNEENIVFDHDYKGIAYPNKKKVENDN